jgi:6,7-dimethyl-8-ribityllumazine synthase
VVATRWHPQVTEGLVAGAQRALAHARVEDTVVVRVPGAFELPIAAKALAQQRFDGVVALGVVIRGGTPHFEYVCRAVTDGLTRVALDTGVPVGFGVLTCDDDAQALDRCGLPDSSEDKGQEAAMAAVETALLLRKLRRGEGHEEATGR